MQMMMLSYAPVVMPPSCLTCSQAKDLGQSKGNATMAILEHIKNYCKSSTIHGLKYITENDRHWSERLFWVTAIVASLWAAINITYQSYLSYVSNPVSFAVETSYLHWNTSFAAVTICEAPSNKKIWGYYREKHKGETTNLIPLITSIMYPEERCSMCTQCRLNNKTCSTLNITDIYKRRASCENLIYGCTWNGEPFSCCENFLPLMTWMGPCFSINTLLIRKNGSTINMVVNRKTGPGHLHFSAKLGIRVFLNGINDIPIKVQKSKWEVTSLGTQQIRFKVNEIENDPQLIEIPLNRRGCRFREEKPLDFLLYDVYSYSTCMDECKLKKIMHFCGCVPLIYYDAVLVDYPICTLELGLACISEKYKKIVSSDTEGFPCDCMTGCTEDDISITYATFLYSRQQGRADVDIVMETLPHERFKRSVVRSRLDLVVSLGGIAGLFLGASIISTVELLVFLFIRIFNKTKPTLKPKAKGGARKLSRNIKISFWNKLMPHYTENKTFAYKHPEKEIVSWRSSSFYY